MTEDGVIRYEAGLQPDFSLDRLHDTGDSIEGGLNVNRFLCDQHGGLYLLRSPKEASAIKIDIATELSSVGLIDAGGNYSFRSLSEQAQFMDYCRSLDIETCVPVAYTANGLIVKYVEGVSMDRYLKDGQLDVVTIVLTNVHAAHRKGVVFGDRWARNTIITDNQRSVEVDFDIALEGECAKDFEIAQLLYHLLHFSPHRTQLLAIIKDFYSDKERLADYDVERLCGFLERYCAFFGEGEYEGIAGGIASPVQELVSYFRSHEV